MNKIKLYVQEAYDELLHKVTWPTFAELQQSAVVILVATIILSIVISAMDIVSKTGMENLYKIIVK
ncbi:MAG: preprotein translocase subunit SecE [Chitinophagales bacterium]|nr:preprotein translocase subunit SecE [Chitinophagales bacterium]MBX2985005.1 preprotein translocase subunit SecE [Bacteroidia bacterium]OJV28886.1 MAG: preprotein translocase subunit SecE [Bacteroidetes bacterium 37-13]MCO5280556.1 preprotein translocase subunit SecE [Chitinophagales bacterium]HRN95162.1 preprotein translocase subunit SecE [Chitinophagales bacterium]